MTLDSGFATGVIPAARWVACFLDGRAAGMALGLRAAAVPTLGSRICAKKVVGRRSGATPALGDTNPPERVTG